MKLTGTQTAVINGTHIINRTYYDIESIEKLIAAYYERGGEVIEVIPGSLGYGTTICYGEGLKTAIIQEHYINCWSSGNTIHFYNKMPKKYAEMLEKYYEQQEQEES